MFCGTTEAGAAQATTETGIPRLSEGHLTASSGFGLPQHPFDYRWWCSCCGERVQKHGIRNWQNHEMSNRQAVLVLLMLIALPQPKG